MNDLKNDTNLREAVSRREQQQPLLTDGVNERLTQRLQQETADLWRQDETATATNSVRRQNRRRRQARLWRWAGMAACLILIVCIGVSDWFSESPRSVEQLSTVNRVTDARQLSKSCASVDEKLRNFQVKDARQLMKSCASVDEKLRISQITRRDSIEIADTLGEGIWQSERNVMRAMQMLGECEAVIRESEQKVRNNIVRCTYNATPQPANAVLVTNELGDCEVIETKNIIEI